MALHPKYKLKSIQRTTTLLQGAGSESAWNMPKMASQLWHSIARHLLAKVSMCCPCTIRAPTMADACTCLPAVPLRPPRVGIES